MESLETAAVENMTVPTASASTSQVQSKKPVPRKRRVLTLEEKYRLVKAINNGSKKSRRPNFLTLPCHNLQSQQS